MFIKITLLTTLMGVCMGMEFQCHNRGKDAIWVGIQSNPGHPLLNGGGFHLIPGGTVSMQAPTNWAGRFWGRTGCNSRTHHCDTGDCGNKLQCNGAGGVPPVSLAEITCKGHERLDYYDISLVDGYNMPISIEPLRCRGDGGRYSCKKSACSAHLNDVCPPKLKVINSKGETIACNSACNAFNTDQYCCRGAFGKPETCQASKWPENYPKFFKDRCPDAYSYAYDDHKSTFTCKCEHYLITFG